MLTLNRSYANWDTLYETPYVVPGTVPFFRPSLDEAEIGAVVQCLRSGWLTTGPKTAEFEAAFAAFIGGGVEAIAVNSATAAMHLGLEALGIGEGDEVICPTLTFTATAEVIRYLGATPVLVDMDPATLNLTPEIVAAAITPRTKAIMPVHFAGLACDMTGLRALADQHGLFILDDAAHALPSYHAGQIIGNCHADITTFSFYANKTITTGEGGMLVTRDPVVAARVRKMRLHGIDRDVFNRFTDAKAPWMYDVVAPGFKYNMTDIAAALGIHQLAKAHAFRRRRATLAMVYDAALADAPLILPPKADGAKEHSHHLYIVQLRDDAPVDRNTFIQKMQANGVGCSVHYRPLHQMSYWSRQLGTQSFSAADAYFKTCVSLPLFMDMKGSEQERAIAVIRRILEGKL